MLDEPVEHAPRLPDHLGPDAVAGKDGDSLHIGIGGHARSDRYRTMPEKLLRRNPRSQRYGLAFFQPKPGGEFAYP